MSLHIAGESGMLGQALRRMAPDTPHRWAVIAAGLVGGINDNMARPVNYLRANLRIALDFLESCHKNKLDRVVYVGSSCMYPRGCRQPMRESDLWSGRLEPTNEGYAIAKLAGEALCRAYRQQDGIDYRTAILCNLYGAADRGFREPDRAHVIPALIRRFTEARDKGLRLVSLQGTGSALREFMHVDDAARGIIAYLKADKAPETLNIGSGHEIRVRDLARMVADLVGYRGKIEFVGGEDGMPRKVLDSRAIRGLGWKPTIGLLEGLEQTIKGVTL